MDQLFYNTDTNNNGEEVQNFDPYQNNRFLDNVNFEKMYNPSTGFNNPDLQQDVPMDIPMDFNMFTPAMLNSMGMKGNIHSALFNQVPKQNLFDMNQIQSNQPVTFEPFSAPKSVVPDYIGVRPSRPTNPGQSFYSSTGFDLLSILAYIANRPNPKINIGPVDLSCAFLLVDTRQYDFPIVYSSPTFENLTGYNAFETVGKNCRFLQSPDGRVTSGSRRKFTDNSSVFKLKTDMVQAKEHQVSLVNYKKNGQPFINLVTVIPIMDGDTVTFYVGLQVDMVDQPNKIVENMSNGCWSLNYGKPTFTKQLTDGVEEMFPGMPEHVSPTAMQSIFETITDGPNSDEKKEDWMRLLVENSTDFIHVLTLKGTFLYASPSVERMLGYKPEDLIGKSLTKLCHSGDLVPVIRDLKECATAIDQSLCVIYRAKHKDEDRFSWIECTGKLHGDMGKGRRCIVMTGRLRPIYQLTVELIDSTSNGLNQNDFWFKMSTNGIFLHITPNSELTLGYSPEELVSTSIYQLVPPDRTFNFTDALEKASQGSTYRLSHQLRNKRGDYIDLVTTLYPGEETVNSENPPLFVLGQCRLASSSASSPSTNEALTPPPSTNVQGDLFSSLDGQKSSTTWQYDLHQLRLANKKLREQIEALAPKPFSKKGKRKINNKDKVCLACNRTSTTEWRRGPNGPSTLCNPCGLKYAKGLLRSSSENSQSS